MKTCTACANAFRRPEDPAYVRCRKSGADETADASLAGEMRKEGGACGPSAALWEEST